MKLTLRPIEKKKLISDKIITIERTLNNEPNIFGIRLIEFGFLAMLKVTLNL